MATHYNKLVRDKIITKIENNGNKTKHHTANNEEYYSKLKEKLREEVEEFIQDDTLEELADILEVIDAIKEFKQIDELELQSIKEKKKQTNGAFTQRIILDSVDSQE